MGPIWIVSALLLAAPGELLLDEPFDRPLDGWTAYGGEWTIVDGALRGRATDAVSAIRPPGIVAGEVAIEVIASFVEVANDARWLALAARCQPGAPAPFVQFAHRFDRTRANGIEFAERRGNDTWNVLLARPFNLPPALGEAHRLRFELRGDLARGYIDGRLAAEWWLPVALTNPGEVALVISGCTAIFDMLRIERLAPLGAEERAAMLVPERTFPLIIGHRGGSMHFPENTLAALTAAFDAGADGCEVDVRLSADGVPVLSHDATVDRCTDGTGPVVEQSAAELTALDAGAWKDPRFAGERLPTLEAALALARERDGFLLLDLKVTGQAPAIVPLLTAGDMLDRTIAGPWDPADAAQWRELAPTVPCFHIGSAPDPLPADFFLGLLRRGIGGFNYNGGTLSAAFVRGARRRAMPVYAWTLNDEPAMRRALRLGVDGILTDDPATAVRVSQELLERAWSEP